ncbi:MAG TPA: DUF2007 domain-containing protein [Kofleriaceae bacterium]|nr:DUF2007 domain-containing protein [Kofleriaceae bacterium]
MSEPNRVRIASCRDPAEAAVIEAALRSHGLHVFVNGQHSAAMFSWAAAALSLDVWVDRDEADEAIALIRELREGGEAQLAEGELPPEADGDLAGPADGEEPAAADADDAAADVNLDDTLTRLGKRKRILLALALGIFIGHGTAHMSARAWFRGVVLACVQVMGWRELFGGNAHLGASLVVAAVLMDLVGAVLVISQSSSNLPAARVRRRR